MRSIIPLKWELVLSLYYNHWIVSEEVAVVWDKEQYTIPGDQISLFDYRMLIMYLCVNACLT